MPRPKKLEDACRFPGFRPTHRLEGVFGDPHAPVLALTRREKNDMRHLRYNPSRLLRISIRKGHTYRIVVSDLVRKRPIWFGGADRSEESMDLFFTEWGGKKTRNIRLAVMDMWKLFRTSTVKNAPKAAILFDKFHIMKHLGEALDRVRKSEYGRLSGKERSYIKGQKYTLLSRNARLDLRA